MQPSHTVLIGDFAPLTLGMLADINHAAGLSNILHIIVHSPNRSPLPSGRAPTLADVVRWVQVACQPFGFVQVHTFDSLGLPKISFDYRFDDHLDEQAFLDICQALDIPYKSAKLGIKNHPDQAPPFLHRLPKTCDDAIAIFEQPLAYFHRLAPTCRYFYSQTVCIVGGESSGKTTLVHKLANHYGASVALEMGRLYTHSHLGGSELALQYSDYAPIAINHAKAIDTAIHAATAPITLIDTDFATTQAFCETYEGRTHPLVASLIESQRMDFTIYLDNNVAWVADGMRRLGDDAKRSAFAEQLLCVLARHGISHHTIDDADYHARYLQAVAWIDHHILGNLSDDGRISGKATDEN